MDCVSQMHRLTRREAIRAIRWGKRHRCIDTVALASESLDRSRRLLAAALPTVAEGLDDLADQREHAGICDGCEGPSLYCWCYPDGMWLDSDGRLVLDHAPPPMPPLTAPLVMAGAMR